MAAVASALPEPPIEPLKLSPIKSNADMGIGVERFRITSSGNVMIRTGIDTGLKLDIYDGSTIH